MTAAGVYLQSVKTWLDNAAGPAQVGVFTMEFHSWLDQRTGPNAFLAWLDVQSPGSKALVKPHLDAVLATPVDWLTILAALLPVLLPIILQLFGINILPANLSAIVNQIIAMLNGFLPVPVPTLPAGSHP